MRPTEPAPVSSSETKAQPTPDAPQPQGATFRLAISGVPRTLDPAQATDNQSIQVVQNTFEGLMTYGKELGPLKYGAAESHTVSDDGLVYTFRLRPDLTWSDGQPLTAYDFVHAWQRVLAPATVSSYGWLLTDVARIKGAADFAKGAANARLGVEASDAQTLTVTLTAPVPYFLDLTAFATFAPIPRHADQAGVPWNGTTTWISNGPFVLSEESSTRNFVLERNPRYWDAAAVDLERVEILVIEDDNARIAAYDAGDLDWTGPQDLPLNKIQTLASRRDYHQDVALTVEYLTFNTILPPFDDARVRNALALAIDRDEIVISVLGGVGQAAYGFVPPIPGYLTRVHRTQDLDRAKALLAEAGYPNGENFPTITYLYPSNNTNAKTVGELVRRQLLGSLGVELVLDDLPLADLLDVTRRHRYQMARAAWVGDFVDPVAFLGLWESHNLQNKAAWKNPRYDTLLADAAKESDASKRYALYAEAEALLDEELPIAPLFYPHQTYLLKPDISGFAAHKLNVHLLKYLTRTQPQN